MRISDWSSDVCSSDLHGRHARAIKKMGMPLRGREHASTLAIGLTQVPVGGARSEAALRLHCFEHRREGGRCEGQAVAKRGEGARRRRLDGDDSEDERSEERRGGYE